MSRNILICSDGTWKRGGSEANTNVWRLYEAVDRSSRSEDKDIRQIAVHDDGVGTSDFQFFKWLGGAFGVGLGLNVRELYGFLCSHYEDGDNIYLFGFSRGAHTIRCLAAVIDLIGVIDGHALVQSGDTTPLDHNHDKVRRAYRYYREKTEYSIREFELERKIRKLRKSDDEKRQEYQQAIDDIHEQTKELEHNIRREFREGTTYLKPRIRMIGVWDTVSAVGGPRFLQMFLIRCLGKQWFLFGNQKLSGCVEFGYQALSIDEARGTFWPVLWKHEERVKQVWFPGVHSNVGGGYPKDGLAYCSLNWMMDEAEQHGLRFSRGARAMVRQRVDPLSQLYNPRAGLGAIYRYRPRDIAKLHADASASYESGSSKLCVHESVIQRIADTNGIYGPHNLNLDFDVFCDRSAATDAYPGDERISCNDQKRQHALSSIRSLFVKPRRRLQYILMGAGMLTTSVVVMTLVNWASVLFGNRIEQAEHGATVVAAGDIESGAPIAAMMETGSGGNVLQAASDSQLPGLFLHPLISTFVSVFLVCIMVMLYQYRQRLHRTMVRRGFEAWNPNMG